MPGNSKHRIVIVGGGFGGLLATGKLSRADVDITLIDKRNFHLFQPLLYQVATGGISPADISSPLRAALKRQRNVRVWQAEAVDVDVERQEVVLRDAGVPYDTLIVSTGARHHYFGNDGQANIFGRLAGVRHPVPALSERRNRCRRTDPGKP